NDVKPMDASLIIDGAIELTNEQKAEFKEIEARTDISVNVIDTSQAMQRAIKILKAGRLLESNSRHNTTLLLASFFNSQGHDEETAVEAIMDVLLNTPREYFSKG